MSIAKIAFAAIIGLFSALIIVGNWWGVIKAKRTNTGFSCVPFIGGALAALCIACTPLKRFFWVGFVIDIGTWSGIIGLPFLIREIIRSRRGE